MNNVSFYFPGFTRKAISFTIDDGNLPLDKRFISIVRPAGIKGTFNLVGTSNMGKLTPEEYREFYRGFEIANHCSNHPKVITQEEREKITDAPFDTKTADTELIYKSELDGLYHKFYRSGWGYIATPETYIKLVDKSKRELESVFGVGSITAFVWPYCEQSDESVKKHLAAEYASVRRTGTAGFELPEDRQCWCYNAIHSNLLERAGEFEALADDGELKLFSFGVHSHDFENNNCWNVLENFAARYGNRAEDFWYATMGEVFAYEDAVRAVTVTDDTVTNNSDLSLYLEHNGRRVVLSPHEAC